LAVKQIIRYSASREKNAVANADESSFKFIVYRRKWIKWSKWRR